MSGYLGCGGKGKAVPGSYHLASLWTIPHRGWALTQKPVKPHLTSAAPEYNPQAHTVPDSKSADALLTKQLEKQSLTTSTGGLMVKNPPANSGDRRPGYDPWVRKIPWRTKWQPTPIFLPRKLHRQRSLAGHHPWGHKESDMTGQLSLHTGPPVVSKSSQCRASLFLKVNNCGVVNLRQRFASLSKLSRFKANRWIANIWQ